MVSDPQESEIKILVTDEEAGRLRERLGTPVRTFRQISYFFETPQDHLAKERLSLRVREESDISGGDERIVLTLKGGGLRAGALMVRPEIESDLDPGTWKEVLGGTLSLAKLDLPSIRRLHESVAGLADMELSPLGSIDNTREVFDFEADDIALEILLDHTTYPDGSASFEIESELSPAMAGQGAKALRSLLDEIGAEWRPSEVGKYVRFRRKIGRDLDAVR